MICDLKELDLWMGPLHVFNYMTAWVTLTIYPMRCFCFCHLIMTGLYCRGSTHSGWEFGLQSQTDVVQIPALTPTCSVTSDKLLGLSMPHFPQVGKITVIIVPLHRVTGGTNEIIQVKCLKHTILYCTFKKDLPNTVRQTRHYLSFIDEETGQLPRASKKVAEIAQKHPFRKDVPSQAFISKEFQVELQRSG